MPVYYPKLIVAGANYCYSSTSNCDECPNPNSEYVGSYPRAYQIHGRGGGIYPAYRMTLVINSGARRVLRDPGDDLAEPADPQQRRPRRETSTARLLDLFHNGAHVSLVAWRTPAGVYWISNTLTDIDRQPADARDRRVADAGPLAPATLRRSMQGPRKDTRR